MNADGRSFPLAGRAFVVCVFVLAGVAGWALLKGRAEEAAVGALCLAAVLVRPLAGTLAAGLAGLLGMWPICALTLLTAFLLRLRALAARIPSRRRPPVRDALADALAELPADALHSAKMRAGAAPLSTWHLVTLASLAEPSRWAGLLSKDPGEEAWDGPAVDLGAKGTVTLFCAEAIGLGAELARRLQRSLQPDLLAVAAAAIPLSAAGEWNADLERTADRVLGIPLVDLIDALAAFSGTEAGRDIMRRAELDEWGRKLAIKDRRSAYEVGASRLLVRLLS